MRQQDATDPQQYTISFRDFLLHDKTCKGLCESRRINCWALWNYRPITRELILSINDDLRNVMSGKKPSILSNLTEAYAFASRFSDVVYKYPYFKKKSLKIIEAIIYSCGEAYRDKKDTVYISERTVKDWLDAFNIDPSKRSEYLEPLIEFKILTQSKYGNYIYSVDSGFCQLVGPAAQVLTAKESKDLTSSSTEQFEHAVADINGLLSLHLLAVAAGNEMVGGKGPKIPVFVKLATAYTVVNLKDLGRNNFKIDRELKLDEVNYVDRCFASYYIQNGIPIERWMSRKVETFEFMIGNHIIEHLLLDGYKLNETWARFHEIAVKRYVTEYLARMQKRYL